MQFFNIIKQPIIEFFKDELNISRDILSSNKITFLEIRTLRKMIGYLQVFYSSNPELMNYVNCPLLSQSTFGFEQAVQIFFAQPIYPFPINTFKEAMSPLFEIFEIVSVGKQIEYECNDNVSYVVALPNGDEIQTILYDRDYHIYRFSPFHFSFMKCFDECFFKHLDQGLHQLSTSGNHHLILFRGKNVSMEDLINYIKTNEERHRYVNYTRNENLKLFNPHKLFYPCKGKYCEHAQCYTIDHLVKYVIQYQQCPCGKKCTFNDIILDTHFKEIMEYSKEDDVRVEIKNNEIVRFYNRDEDENEFIEIIEID